MPWLTEACGDWHFRYRESRFGGWYGEAKRSMPFVDNQPAVWEEGDIHFAFAGSRDKVISKLKSEVFN